MAGHKRITIKDVAREAGLAVSTVSNALAGKALVKPETRALVVQTAQRLGYRASFVARALRSQRSDTLGVLIEDVANPSTSAFVRGVEDIARRVGSTILLSNTDGDLEVQVGAMRALADRQVDGLVLISQHLADERVREIVTQIPTVTVMRRDGAMPLDYVGSDNRAGLVEAMRYVARIGHRRVGFVTGPLVSSAALERLDTFRGTSAEVGFDATDLLVFDGRYSFESGLQAAGFFSGLAAPPTCIFASSDMNAIGLIQGLHERGFAVPQDISVVGLDDIQLAGLKAIDLTTIRLEKRAIGGAAASLVLKRIDDPERTQETLVLPTHLVVRGTTRPTT